MKFNLLEKSKFKHSLFKHLALILVLFFCISNVKAQTNSIKGTVTGAGQPLLGASVFIKGTKTGTITDFDGNYTIKAKIGDIIVYSYLGFTTKEVKVSDKLTMNIELQEDASTLDEIIVVGYGTQKKKEVTGAVAKVNSDEILKVATPDLTTALQGKVAGVNIQAASGSPGENSNIQIRGVGSLSEGALGPLWVVDGIPFEDNPNISPEQIESIDILKDGASASVYGVRASNGVILITTKQGEEGKPNVSFTTYYGIQNITSGTPLLNTLDQFYQNDRRNYLNNGGGSPLFTNTNAFNNDTNYVNAITNDNAAIQNYALNISGGSKNLRLNFNTNYFDQEGVLISSGFNRLSNRLTARFTKGKFAMFGSVNLSQEKKTKEPGNIYERAINAKPYSRPIDDLLQSGDYENSEEDALTGFVRDFLNTDEEESYRTNLAINLEYEIVNGLKFKVNLGRNTYRSFRKLFRPQYLNYRQDDSLNEAGSRLNAQLSERNDANERRSIENILTYNKSFGKHRVGLLAVLSYEDYERRTSRIDALFSQDAPNNSVQVLAAAESVQATGVNTERSLTGKLFRLQYNYDGKYLFSGSIRRDGSSRFPVKNRYEEFFGLSFGWNVHEEPFMQQISNIVNSFKLRGSYAQLGNQNIGDYGHNRIVESGINYPFQDATGLDNLSLGLIERRITNGDLQWETSISSNIGIDLAFFRSKLQITVDAYKNDKQDMLLNFELPGSAGVTQTGAVSTFGRVAVNAGNMTNQGVEFSANFKDRTKAGFKYSIGYTYTANTNKITDLNGIERGFGGGVPYNSNSNGADNTTYFAVGREAGSFFLLENLGVIKTDEQLNDYVSTLDPVLNDITFQKGDLMFKDQNGDGLINDDDLVYSGSGQAKYEIGLNTDLAYKNFDFSAQAYFSYGAKVYNGSKIYAYRQRRHQDLLYMWTPQNPDSDIFAERGVNSENIRTRTDYFLEDGSYLRIRSLTFGYTIPKTNKFGITKARVYLTSVNPFTFTKYEGYDPEVGGNGLLTRGVDKGNYPVSRQFSVGVQVNF